MIARPNKTQQQAIERLMQDHDFKIVFLGMLKSNRELLRDGLEDGQTKYQGAAKVLGQLVTTCTDYTIEQVN